MGIALKVIMIAVLVFVGFAFGAQPLIGYNYGARNMPRLRGILRFSYLFLSLFALVMTVVLSLSDRLLMGFFIEDATIITLGAGMLRVQLLSLVCVAVVMVTTCTFQSAGKAVGAFVLSISRQGCDAGDYPVRRLPAGRLSGCNRRAGHRRSADRDCGGHPVRRDVA